MRLIRSMWLSRHWACVYAHVFAGVLGVVHLSHLIYVTYLARKIEPSRDLF